MRIYADEKDKSLAVWLTQEEHEDSAIIQSESSYFRLDQQLHLSRSRWKMVFLCVVIGHFSRKGIGWNLSSKPDTNLVTTAFKKANSARNVSFRLMFHSDRGSQYPAFAFRLLLKHLSVVQSFSKKRYPFDNTVCESFFKFLKKELTNRRTYRTADDLKHDLFDYIEGFTTIAALMTLGYLTPNEAEAVYWNNLQNPDY